MENESCAHIAQITTIKQPATYECSECVKHGGEWMHLRTWYYAMLR